MVPTLLIPMEPGTLPRRSRRLAGAEPCSPSPVVNLFQKRVMRSLGFGREEKITPKMQDEYCLLFEHELSDTHLAALTALFGWAASNRVQLDSKKLLLLQEVRDIRALCNGPWLIAGDFNLIYQATDKNNTNLDKAMMGRFRRLLDDLEIKEIPLVGRKYTWSNERSSLTLVRLDRAFCYMGWEEVFKDSVLQGSASVVSDHCPLILGLNINISGKRHFQLQSFWTKIPGFIEALQQNWEAPVASACAVECLFLKL
ncbi:hypothetical protein U9M48_012868 [Paspalum notatum var. saurae]|uniref:Endonuclease/exonuclease/phosphatase domain-containing protein n=1 Tax=Paspalum notatum var. saurae TaxID=547442 RepID=A0AAQ3WJ27_PASNO